MAIKFTKPAIKKAPTPSASGPLAAFMHKDDVSPIADEIQAFGLAAAEAGPVLAQIKELTLKLKPMKDAEAKLLAAIDTMQLDPDVEDRLEKSEGFAVYIGPRKRERSVDDMQAVRKALGEATFMKLATVKLGDLDKYLTPEEIDPLVTVARGKHSFKVNPRV